MCNPADRLSRKARHVMAFAFVMAAAVSITAFGFFYAASERSVRIASACGLTCATYQTQHVDLSGAAMATLIAAIVLTLTGLVTALTTLD
jgi:hypothetical protein